MEAIKYEPREDIKMFGCEQTYLDWLAKKAMERGGGLLMMVAGMMSDAQEAIETDEKEMARQILNRAKYIVFNYLEKD